MTQYVTGRKSRKGFTLMELLVVIMIMGILMSMVIGLWKLISGKGREARAKAEMQEISKVITDYQAKYGRVPQLLTDQGVAEEIRKLLPKDRQIPPSDPWEKPYQYRPAQGRQSFSLYSFGKDGLGGSALNDADNVHSDRID